MKSLLSISLLFMLLACGSDQSTKTEENNVQSAELTSENKTNTSDQTVIVEKHSEEQIDTIKATKNGVIDVLYSKGKKGKTLFVYNNESKFEHLVQTKLLLKSHIDSLNDLVGAEMNFVKPKWVIFSNGIRKDTLLPMFPAIQYREEGLFYGSPRTTILYKTAVEEENAMRTDFITASKAYSTINWQVKKGTRVKKGQIIGYATVKQDH